jgi:SAM-dependent methyltransferase
VRKLIALTEGTPLGPYVTPQTFELSAAGGDSLAAGRAEHADGPRFFSHFAGRLTPEDLRGQDLLDLGCGYGGRTVYYAQRCGASAVEGVEITSAVVERCERLAAALGADNARFRVGFAERLPFDSDRFDGVLSYDVLEHVQDPAAAFTEVARVLRPGGMAWLAFPSYLGARSSHLDYITRLPALHRVFDPDTLVRVVNEFLERQPSRYGVQPQPPPAVGVLGHRTLPTVNGMTRHEALALSDRAGLILRHEELVPVVHSGLGIPGSRLADRVLRAALRRSLLPELVVGSVALVLEKPGHAP